MIMIHGTKELIGIAKVCKYDYGTKELIGIAKVCKYDYDTWNK